MTSRLPEAGGCRLSIVIPTRNSKAVLAACVDSVLRQTFSDFEIVIVDGASTDGTVDLIRGLAAENKTIRWISEKDTGVYDAMNKGIKLARAPWVYFLGSDDRLYDESVLTRVAEHLDDRVDLVYGDVLLEKDPWGRDGAIYGGEFSVRDITRKNICHQAIFYSRALLESFSGYDLRYLAMADWELNLRVFNKVRKKYVPLTIACFRGGGLSSKNSDAEFNLHFVEIITRELGLDGSSPLYREQARGLRRLWPHYLRRGKLGLAAKYFVLWLRHENFSAHLSAHPFSKKTSAPRQAPAPPTLSASSFRSK